MRMVEKVKNQMNQFGATRRPFVVLVDFLMEHPQIIPIDEINGDILWKTPKNSNIENVTYKNKALEYWKSHPISFFNYKKGFDLVKEHILKGDSYLLNYTQPTKVETNLSLEDIFFMCSAPYKIFFKNKFVCFSPEIFVKIQNGRVSSYPMKGTIDANIKNAKEILLADVKELAEHNTIVDLIRNDLSMVAENVRVEKFRYIDKIHTAQKDLLQVSSEIIGDLPIDYLRKIGDIVFKLLPAGSISGAPKNKTVEIINSAEKYNRGYYTGIFGVFDGQSFDSCVLIRFIEKQNNELVYKSGGGVTFMSNVEDEYNEMIEKVYVPIN